MGPVDLSPPPPGFDWLLGSYVAIGSSPVTLKYYMLDFNWTLLVSLLALTEEKEKDPTLTSTLPGRWRGLDIGS